MTRRVWGFLLAVSIVAAVIGRWPIALHPDALPLDPNSGLHALVVDALRHGSFTRVLRLNYPEGNPIRMVGAPALFLAAAVSDRVGPSTALELARTAWLAFQGVAVGALAVSLGLGARGAIVAAALAVLNPFVLHASSNGQHENIVLAPLALALWAGLNARPLSARRGGEPDDPTEGSPLRPLLAAVVAILTVAFCSPYHLVPAALMLAATAATRGRRSLVLMVVTALLTGLIPAAYYVSAIDPASVYGRPATEFAVPAPLLDLVWPRASVFFGSVDLRTPFQRVAAAAAPIPTLPLTAAWPFTQPTSAPYLGLGLIGLGLAGYRGASPRLRAVGVGGLACLVVAFGPWLYLTASTPTPVPLPWGVVASLPGLNSLTSTTRFLSGVVLALTLGAGALAARTRWTALLVPWALADTLLIAPIEWPVRAAYVKVEIGALPEGPVAAWPPVGDVMPQVHALLSLAIERPLVLATDHVDVDAWYARVGQSRAGTLVQFQPIDGRPRWTPTRYDHGLGTCAAMLCVRPLLPGTRNLASPSLDSRCTPAPQGARCPPQNRGSTASP